MKAMILAAGLGTRMRPLTNTVPKPLIPVGGKPLIVYHIERCVAVGITQLVINISYLGQMIQQYLGTGERWGVQISYSVEAHPLDVAGGLRHALPLLGHEPFWCLSADVYSDFVLPTMNQLPRAGTLGHLVMVPNPAHHPNGDFALLASNERDDGIGLLSKKGPYLTYSGMALLDPRLLSLLEPTDKQFAPLLHAAMDQALLTGQFFSGLWSDVGTPERLKLLESTLGLRAT